MQLRIFTDSSFTTNWMSHPSGLSLFLFLRMNRVSGSAYPVSSQIPPSNLLEIEEVLNIYRITTWIQNSQSNSCTQQFLEIGIWGNYFVWLNCICLINASLHWEFSSFHHHVTVSPLHFDSIKWPKSKQGEGERLVTRTHGLSIGKWIFCKLCFPFWKIEAIVENVHILQEEKHHFLVKLYWV